MYSSPVNLPLLLDKGVGFGGKCASFIWQGHALPYLEASSAYLHRLTAFGNKEALGG